MMKYQRKRHSKRKGVIFFISLPLSLSRITTLTNTQKKLEEKIVTLEESIKNNNSMHSVSIQYPLLSCLLIQIQKLMDEHSELQLEFNSQDKKLKDLQGENDRLVK